RRAAVLDLGGGRDRLHRPHRVGCAAPAADGAPNPPESAGLIRHRRRIVALPRLPRPVPLPAPVPRRPPPVARLQERAASSAGPVICSLSHPADLWRGSMKVPSILKVKGSTVATPPPRTSIVTAARLLRDQHIGALVVSEDGATVIGIITERDVVHGLADRGAALLEMPVSLLMTHHPIISTPDDH